MLERKLSRLESHQQKSLENLEKAFNRRLISGLITFAALVAAAFDRENTFYNSVGFVLGPITFIFFFIASQRIKKHCRQIEEWVLLIKRMKERCSGHLEFNKEESRVSSNAAHARDLDLFTQQGLFDLIDETITQGGRNLLIERIINLTCDREKIAKRQELAKRLSKHSWFISKLIITGRLNRDFSEHSHQLSDFVKRPFLEKGFHRDYLILTVLFALSTFGIVNAWGGWAPGLSPYFFLSIHFIYSLIASSNLKGVFERANDMAIQLSSLMPVMQMLEKKCSHPDFKELLTGIDRFSPSRRMKRLNFIISSLSVQAHPLVYILINGLLPWSFFFAKRLEKQRQLIENDFPAASEDLYEFEFLISLALVHRYQSQTFPEILEAPGLRFEQAFHPLIPRGEVVANSFTLNEPIRLNVITGSNMSGKSSFLRTIGVNHVLLCLGAPVFAKNYAAYPFQLASCIRVTDALDGGISYFYAEVLRLKEIMNETKDEPPVLYLIDEIFRGTNNRERLIGSQSVLEELAESDSVGFVTTHDLELTQLADQFEKVDNWHFRDDVENGEMVFNYRLLPGPCPTTNALKIMKKSGLPVKEFQAKST